MADANPIRSFQDINPTAGNTGDKSFFGRNAAREVNRAVPQDRASKGGVPDFAGLSKIISGAEPKSTVGVIPFGPGRFGISVSNVIAELHKDHDCG